MAIAIAIDSGALGGYFRWRPRGRRHWQETLLELGVRLRSQCGVPYGDQGLFVARETFEVCGGFAPTPLFEQVPLVKAVRRQGRFDALALPISVAEGPWARRGWLRHALSNRLLALGYIAGFRRQHWRAGPAVTRVRRRGFRTYWWCRRAHQRPAVRATLPLGPGHANQ